jgi:thymidine phosphorylase
VGIVFRAKVGDRVEVGEPIGKVHARDEKIAGAAIAAVNAALTVSESPVEPPPLVHRWRDA